MRTWGHLEVTGEAILNESLDRVQSRNCCCDGLGSRVGDFLAGGAPWRRLGTTYEWAWSGGLPRLGPLTVPL